MTLTISASITLLHIFSFFLFLLFFFLSFFFHEFFSVFSFFFQQDNILNSSYSAEKKGFKKLNLAFWSIDLAFVVWTEMIRYEFHRLDEKRKIK